MSSTRRCAIIHRISNFSSSQGILNDSQTTLNEQHWKISIGEKVISQYINFLCCAPLSSDFLCQFEFLHRSEHIRRSIRYWFKQLRKKLQFPPHYKLCSIVLHEKNKVQGEPSMIYYVDRAIYEPYQEPSCLSLGCAGRFIAFVELVFYTFVFLTAKNYASGKYPKSAVCTFLNYVENQSLKLRDTEEEKNSGNHDKQHFYLFSTLRMSFRWCWWIIHPGADPLTPLHLLGVTFHWRN